MKKILVLLTALLAISSARAYATSVTLTFTGLGDQTPIGNYYNGGAGGNLGISFGPDALSIISDQAGGSGNFSNVPPPSTNTVAFFLGGAGDVMNVAAGFTTGFAFSYAAVNDAGVVTVWSGLNDTGTLLETINLPVTGDLCDGKTDYSCWVNTGGAFVGTAESVDFSGTANQIAFANITIGAASVPTGATPEPSSLVLLGSGLVGLAGAVRRKLFA
jgi:PEP-CTERM motif